MKISSQHEFAMWLKHVPLLTLPRFHIIFANHTSYTFHVIDMWSIHFKYCKNFHISCQVQYGRSISFYGLFNLHFNIQHVTYIQAVKPILAFWMTEPPLGFLIFLIFEREPKLFSFDQSLFILYVICPLCLRDDIHKKKYV